MNTAPKLVFHLVMLAAFGATTASVSHAAVSPDAKAYLHFVSGQSKWSVKKVAQQALEFRKTYPTSIFADNVLYRAGEGYFLKKQYQPAGELFSRLLKWYPKSDKSLAARYAVAVCYLKLGQKNKALDLLKKLRQRYPNSQEARHAKLMLDSM